MRTNTQHQTDPNPSSTTSQACVGRRTSSLPTKRCIRTTLISVELLNKTACPVRASVRASFAWGARRFGVGLTCWLRHSYLGEHVRIWCHRHDVGCHTPVQVTAYLREQGWVGSLLHRRLPCVGLWLTNVVSDRPGQPVYRWCASQVLGRHCQRSRSVLVHLQPCHGCPVSAPCGFSVHV